MSFRAFAISVSLLLACPLLDATIIDLTAAGSSGIGTGTIGGTFQVQQIDPQSTGTGVIDSFLRINQNGQERGYNTDAGTPLDDLGGGFTRSLLLSDIPIVNGYYQFLLDINQTNANPLLSLNQIQIFQTNNPNALASGLTEANSTTPTDALVTFGAGTSEVFRLNNTDMTDAARTEIQLNYSLNPGSGAGDMFLYVPVADFSSGFSNVVLFSQFGSPRGQYSSNDGFEEWAVLSNSSTTSDVPEPASIALLGTMLCGVAWRLRRRAS